MPKRGRYGPKNLIASDNLKTNKGEGVSLPNKLDNPEIEAQWIEQLQDPGRPRVIDLFCGAGGMSEGFLNRGFVIAAAYDHDKVACETYQANIPARVTCTDIAQIADPVSIAQGLGITSVDVIIG